MSFWNKVGFAATAGALLWGAAMFVKGAAGLGKTLVELEKEYKRGE